ncbi:MAG: hypothetical protein K0S32_2696 [Bacteroidetes bacterium]|nr:hypothetical protein [Bacteroidota bacterium]
MQPDKNMSDLEYLAEMGFDKVKVSDSDISELKSKVKSRVFSYNNGFYFGFVSLVTGAFLGISVFFIFYNAPKIFPAPKTLAEKEIPAEKTNTPEHLALDTVNVVAENFILPKPVVKTSKEPEIAFVPSVADTAVVLESKPVTAIIPGPEKINEIQIKYIPNSPIIFLHDLKITNYTSLYFKKNRFVTLSTKSGLDPSYANKDELRKYENVFTTVENYYLHEAIGEAMLYFSKKDFNRCLRTLQTVQSINPDDINCHFYSGMCYYYKKNYAGALKNLEACINNSNNTFLNEAQYYKAMSLYEQGNKIEAVELFKQIATEGGFYAEKAKSYLF